MVPADIPSFDAFTARETHAGTGKIKFKHPLVVDIRFRVVVDIKADKAASVCIHPSTYSYCLYI